MLLDVHLFYKITVNFIQSQMPSILLLLEQFNVVLKLVVPEKDTPYVSHLPQVSL